MVAQQAPLCNTGSPVWHGALQGSLGTTQSWGCTALLVPSAHSPHCSVLNLGTLPCGRAGDEPRESWLSSAPAAGAASPTHGCSDIPHPLQTSLRGQGSHGRESHDLPGDMQGTVCFPLPLPFYWGHWGEARLRGGGVSLSLVQSMCCGRGGQVSRTGEMDVPCPPWM